ncbi:unnamed protein product [Closterium sp. Naga37s-1]|nr:unnamed protein product [Closterium sp. Naga37s-1]
MAPHALSLSLALPSLLPSPVPPNMYSNPSSTHLRTCFSYTNIICPMNTWLYGAGALFPGSRWAADVADTQESLQAKLAEAVGCPMAEFFLKGERREKEVGCTAGSLLGEVKGWWVVVVGCFCCHCWSRASDLELGEAAVCPLDVLSVECGRGREERGGEDMGTEGLTFNPSPNSTAFQNTSTYGMHLHMPSPLPPIRHAPLLSCTPHWHSL